jgi:hypothetical protein
LSPFMSYLLFIQNLSRISISRNRPNRAKPKLSIELVTLYFKFEYNTFFIIINKKLLLKREII